MSESFCGSVFSPTIGMVSCLDFSHSDMSRVVSCCFKLQLPKDKCGSDHELLIAKFKLKLKKVVKTTRPFRYDLNQIPYDYIVEVRNRFKGLDLIESLMNYRWKFMTLYRRQDQDHPHGKKMQKDKMVVWGGLTNSYEKKGSEKQRRKGKIVPFECRFPKSIQER